MEVSHQKILESILTPIVLANDRLIIKYINTATVATFGYTLEEIQDKNVKILMPPETALNHDKYVENYKDGKTPKVIE